MKDLSGLDSALHDAIIALLIWDNKFAREWADKIQGQMFRDPIRFTTAQYALEFFEDTRMAAKILIKNYVKDHARRDRVAEDRLKIVFKYLDKLEKLIKRDGIAIGYVTDQLEQFFETARLEETRFQLDQAMDQGDIKAAKDVLQTAMRNGQVKGRMKPIDYFATLHSRQLRRDVVAVQQDGVHFLIPTLESKGIYAHRGEITLGIAPSKRGKSIWLTHMGKSAVFQGQHVLHVSLENPITMVEDRYDAMFSGISTQELRYLADMLETKMTDVEQLCRGRLHLLWRAAKQYSPVDLRVDIETMRAEGKRIDVAIVDYGELMKPVAKTSGDSRMRADLNDIFVHLRSVATDMDVTVVTAQQTPLKKRSKYRLGMEDGQEASMPSQHSSLIVTLNQTPDEYENNEMRLLVSGYWHGPCWPGVPEVLLKQDFDRMQFCIKEIPLEDGIEASKGTP